MNFGRSLAPRMNDATFMDLFDSILASMGSLWKWKRIDGEGNESRRQS